MAEPSRIVADALPTELLDTVVAGADARVVLTDRAARLVWASPALRPLLRGRRLLELVHPDDRRDVAAAYRQLLEGPARTLRHQCRVLGVDGYAGGELVMHEASGVEGVATTLVPVGRSGDAEALAHRADHDALTGLANRPHLLRVLARPGPLAVLFGDLDGFKEVNDTLGHAVGDQLLVAVGERLRRAVRPGDTVGRPGGDEFVVVAAGVEQQDVAVEIATRVQVALCQPYHVAGRTLRVTASIGVSLGAGGPRAASLLTDADAAMYLAKRAGGARTQLFQPGMASADNQRAAATEKLRTVLDAGKMVVAYAPVVDLATGGAVARSAALHLLDGSGTALGSLVDGSSVAEAAERSGLAVSVGAGLLDAACAEAAAVPDAGPVWVPLSAGQVSQPRLAALVASTLDRHGLDPAMLLVEVAADVVASADAPGWRTLADLRSVGVRLGLSGFGSGGANPAVLRRAAPDVVVLDTTWTAAMGTDEAQPAVVAALVALGRALGAKTAAEAVGRPEQAAALLDAGCELASGTLWPAPPPQATRSGDRADEVSA